MATRTSSTTSRDKVRAYRKRLRQQGLRPIQIWVPDVSSPAFAKEAHRQSRVVARSAQEKEDQDFIDSISDWNDMGSAARDGCGRQRRFRQTASSGNRAG